MLEEIERIIVGDSGEIFEDGMESRFSRKLVALIKQYGNDAIDAIGELIRQRRMNVENVAEAMRWLGCIESPPTHHKRLQLLTRGLVDEEYRVRDGAIRGLGSLDSPEALPALDAAIRDEPYTELRQDMEGLRDDLNVYRMPSDYELRVARLTNTPSRGFCVSADIEQITAESYQHLYNPEDFEPPEI